MIDPLQKQKIYKQHWPLDRVLVRLFTLWCFVVGTLAAMTRAFVLRSGMMLARLFMKEVRVNERAPSAGVAYCTPTRLGRSRVEYFLSISLCIMLGVGSHALYAWVRHSLICFTSKRLLLLVEWWDISGVSKGFRAWVYTHLAANRDVFLLCYANYEPATGIRLDICLISK